MRLVSANLNGVRAAARRGGLAWLAGTGADVICLQEVRAGPEQLRAALAGAGIEVGGRSGWQLVAHAGPRAGHAGVAVLSRLPLTEVGSGMSHWSGQGRWSEVLVAGSGPSLAIVSAYVHKGDVEGPRALEKDRFLSDMGRWLAAHSQAGAILCGDMNVAHTEADIKNWRGNIGRAGFLPGERAHLDRWFSGPPDGLGWVDLGRRFAGDGPGPYTWWSWRGRSFDNDAGWRIDYAIASPPAAAMVNRFVVARAPDYASRWSDHAALVLDL